MQREREVLSSKIIEKQEELREIKKKRAGKQKELRKIKKKRAGKQKERQADELQSRQFEKAEIRKILNNLKHNKLKNIPRLEKSKAPIAYGEFNERSPVEEKAILAELKSNGLEKDAKLKRFKIGIYKYSKPRKAEKTKKLCDVFITFKSVQSCKPDVSVQSQQSSEDFYKESEIGSVSGCLKHSDKISSEMDKACGSSNKPTNQNTMKYIQ